MQRVTEKEVELLWESNDGYFLEVVPESSDWVVDWARHDQDYEGSNDPGICYEEIIGDEHKVDFEMLASLFNYCEEINCAFWDVFDEYVHNGWSEVGDLEE